MYCTVLEFSTEEQAKFARRFEARHHAWLSIHHPDAVNFEVTIYTLEVGPSSQTLAGTHPLPEHHCQRIKLNSVVQFTWYYESIGIQVYIF